MSARRTGARRRRFAALALVLAAGLGGLAVAVLALGGWSAWEVAILLLYLLNLPWLALAGATGLAGLLARPDPSPLPPPGPPPATLLAVCLRDEAMEEILPRLGALWRALEVPATVALLSDTTDPARAAAEDAAVRAFAAGLPPGVVRHRRRAANTGWKAGNLMDFLDHHAEGHAFLLLLDADSAMDPALVAAMVRRMHASPRLAILQATIAGQGARTRFAHWFGLGHAPGARVWAAGQAWWQGPQGAFWGHNALLRIAPFRTHARLEPLPDGAHILSHDFVEAARLHRAGWEVRVMPVEDGSWEGHPPDLPAFLDRDRRWAAGNMQYRFLLRDRRLSRLGRFQMAQAMAHYLLAPAWFALLPLAVLNAVSGGAEGTPRALLLGWVALSYAALHLPRLGGHARQVRRRGWPALGAAAAESLFLLLLEAVMALDKSWTVLAHALGCRRPGWPAQRRDGGGIGWGAAARRLWPHSLAGVAMLAALLAWATPFAALAALPALAGLVLAVPFCVLSSRPR
ncbi:glycosyltransferase family 2 protein [Roseococcus sp. DSY-14]|uniref:glycosyltransferase family 2 protein n=1 Tax=Roseococcus sp. DSY-14 TaxID=3369650 RepID=UPI00387B88BB